MIPPPKGRRKDVFKKYNLFLSFCLFSSFVFAKIACAIFASMQPDNKRVKLANEPRQVVENFAAFLMALPENVRLNIVIEYLVTVEDLMRLKDVSEEIEEWMNVYDVVVRWERKHLYTNDYWRSYIMQRFAFEKSCTVAISNYENATVRFDGMFRNENAVELDEMLANGFDIAESLMSQFELHLIIQPTLQSTLLKAFEQFYKISLQTPLANVEPNGELQYVKSNIYCTFFEDHVEIVLLFVNPGKRRSFDFLCNLMETFETAHFPNAVLQNPEEEEDEEKQVWVVQKLRSETLVLP